MSESNPPNLNALREEWLALNARQARGELGPDDAALVLAALERRIVAAVTEGPAAPVAVQAQGAGPLADSVALGTGSAHTASSTASATAASVGSAISMPSAPTATAVRSRVPTSLWVASAVAVLVISAVGYGWKGSPRAVGTPPAGFESAGAGAGGGGAGGAGAGQPGTEQVDALIKQLEERLAKQPGDAEGWALLARSQMALSRYADASASYEKLRALKPDDPTPLADHADALGVLNGRTLEGEPARLLERALKLDPKHVKSLVLVGTLEYQRGNFAGAEKQWAEAVRVGPPGDGLVELAREGVTQAQARQRAAASAPAGAAAAAPAPQAQAQAQAQKPPAPSGTTAAGGGGGPAAAGSAVSGTVRLSDALKSKAAPGDTVFVFARAASGSPMPLAIQRLTVAELPATFTLNDSMAMSPAAKISSAESLVVVARVSKSGQAMPQPGDLEGVSAAVAPGARDLAIEIGNVRP